MPKGTQIPDEEIAEYRRLLIDKIEREDPERRASLALSGGTDSVAVLFAMLASGRKPDCYTFRCEGVNSSDHQSAVALCEHFGLKHHSIVVPWDLAKLEADCRYLVSKAHVIKDTIIQCMHPWLYIYPAMSERKMFCGLGGDDLYCTQLKVQKELRMKGEQAVRDNGWRKVYSDDPIFSTWNIINLGREVYGKALIDAYHDPAIEAWFLKFPIRDLHTPFEKAPSVLAFSEFYSQGPFRRAHASYQINSKLKDMHQQLLQLPAAVEAGAKGTIWVYRRMATGEI